MASNFFNELFTSITDGTANITSQMSGVIGLVMPAFQACFFVYVMFVVYSYWEGESSIQGTAIDLFKRIVSWAILLGFGMNIGTYMSVVMPFVTDLGNDLAQAFGGADSASALDSVVDKIAQIVDENAQGTEEASAGLVDVAASGATETGDEAGFVDSITGAISDLTAGVMDAMVGGLYDKVAMLFKNIILIIFGGLYIAVAAAYLMVAQVLLVVLAAVGPIFFGFALFPATRTFFTNWIGSVLNYGFFFLFVTILVHMSLGLVDAQLDTYYEAVKQFYSGGSAGLSEGLSSIVTVICMFLVFTIVLFQLPQLASSLFGGLAAGTGSMATVMKPAMRMAGKVASVGMGAAKGAASAAREGAGRLAGSRNKIQGK